tara:strand:+ start:9480 stop:10187 length:708 start_codon:yes stop_codon:yes gene_type:complete
MKVPHISASSVKTWKNCKLQFYAEKILKVERSPLHPLTKMGIAVHEAFERSVEDKDFIAHLSEACNNQGLDEDLVGLSTELCKTCEDWGWWDDIDELDHCIPEYEFLIHIGEGINVKGFIDRLDMKGDSATILDIKTQSKKFSADELRNNLQADIYNLATRMNYPRIKSPIRVEFWVLRHEIQSVTRTLEDAMKTKEYLLEIGKEIMSHPDELYPEAQKNPNCRWCDYKNNCPEW